MPWCHCLFYCMHVVLLFIDLNKKSPGSSIACGKPWQPFRFTSNCQKSFHVSSYVNVRRSCALFMQLPWKHWAYIPCRPSIIPCIHFFWFMPWDYFIWLDALVKANFEKRDDIVIQFNLPEKKNTHHMYEIPRRCICTFKGNDALHRSA